MTSSGDRGQEEIRAEHEVEGTRRENKTAATIFKQCNYCQQGISNSRQQERNTPQETGAGQTPGTRKGGSILVVRGYCLELF